MKLPAILLCLFLTGCDGFMSGWFGDEPPKLPDVKLTDAVKKAADLRGMVDQYKAEMKGISALLDTSTEQVGNLKQQLEGLKAGKERLQVKLDECLAREPEKIVKVVERFTVQSCGVRTNHKPRFGTEVISK